MSWRPRPAPLALVHRGRATTPGCPEALAALLQDSRWGFDVEYVGPREPRGVTTALRAGGAALYAQPGGGTLGRAYRALRVDAPAVRDFVHGGGRYLGVCLGGYLAGATPGFDLLPGDTDRYISSPGSTVGTTHDTVVALHWRGRLRHLYFQDGPVFRIDESRPDVTVLARYANGDVAAVVAAAGRGKVGVTGPHPEATADWYAERGLVDPDGLDADLGQDLVDTLMR